MGMRICLYRRFCRAFPVYLVYQLSYFDCFRYFGCHFGFRLRFGFCKIVPCVCMGCLVVQSSLIFLFHWLVSLGLLLLGGPSGQALLSTVLPVGVYSVRFSSL